MSHVDEGTLHAYLDGELPRVEAERVRSHLESCAACQGLIEEERTLIERANRLLERAAPPLSGRPVPTLDSLVPRAAPPRPRLPYVPLAWAATLLLAIGLGWYLRGTRFRPVDAVAIQPPSAQPVAVARPAAPATVVLNEGAGERQDVAAPKPPAGEVDRAARTEIDTTRVFTSPPPPALAAGNAVAQSPAPTAAANPIVPRDEVASKAIVSDSEPNAARTSADVWRDVSVDSARTLLGGAFATIPGIPISRIQATAASPVVWITLTPDSRTTIALYEQRAENNQATLVIVPEAGMRRRSVSQRQARYVGALRVEITGTVSADSLSRLLDLVR